MTIVVAKLALAVAGALAAIVSSRSPRLHAIAPARFDALAIAFVAASRLALFAALYLVVREPVRSDVPTYYLPQGLAVLDGRVPYRDFATSYAPLFPYVCAAVLAAWRSPLALVLFAIGVEVATIGPWLRAMRACAPERTVRVATVLYATCAIPILAVAVNGGNHVLCAASLVASLLLARRAPAASGAAMALGVDAVKLIAAVVAPAPLFASRSRGRWLLGFALAIALVYGTLAALGIDPLVAARAEATRVSSGTLPFLVAALAGADASTSLVGWISEAALVVVLVALFADCARRPIDRDAIPALGTLVLALFMLLARKAYGPYLVMAFFPLCVVVAGAWHRAPVVALFVALGVGDAIERSLWAALGTPTSRVLAAPGGALLVAVDAVCVAAHAGVAALAWRDLRRRAPSHADVR